MPRWSNVRRAAALGTAVALALMLGACASGPSVDVTMPAESGADGALPDDTQQQLQAAVERAMAATGSTGSIVGVWAPWSGQWVAASARPPRAPK